MMPSLEQQVRQASSAQYARFAAFLGFKQLLLNIQYLAIQAKEQKRELTHAAAMLC